MKQQQMKKIGLRLLACGGLMTALGVGINMFTLFNVYDRADDPDCQSGAGCDVGEAVSTQPAGRWITYVGLLLLLFGLLIILVSVLRKRG